MQKEHPSVDTTLIGRQTCIYKLYVHPLGLRGGRKKKIVHSREVKCSLSSRGLCPAGVPRCPETNPHGGHESPGHAIGRRPCQSQSPAQDGNPQHGWTEAGRPASQTQASGHQHSDAFRLLRRHALPYFKHTHIHTHTHTWMHKHTG